MQRPKLVHFLSPPLIGFLCLTSIFSNLLPANSNPEELGKVAWLRDFDQALALSKKEGKPIFILFQEVPGCATCRNYGHHVMSHPLIVEAIETLFVPVAIFNNKDGADARVLKLYGEPSWNNPVVRIVDDQKANLVPRVAGDYSQLGVVRAMILGLKKHGQETPNYLSLLYQELVARQRQVETANLSMYCFWSGEKILGAIDGVIATRPGFMHGAEIVQVQYDPQVISFDQVIRKAGESGCAQQVFSESPQQRLVAEKLLGKNKTKPASSFRPDKDPKYYLSQSVYRFVPMTSLQASRANSMVGQGKSPDSVLSPKQIALASFVKNHPEKKWPDLVEKDLTGGWELVESIWKK